ncbi:carboxynorspermidine decarboxylase [Pelagerythrobacter marinus]|uniref:carboxynorspermidine decarboxylase n=1 Tax=Pelagerythrobacter marinus TaxID=538382 RepID=UPI00203734F9|nr:carboxynorspermidine decarboxylase [Pelagerythrobacter marinus]USA40488.1 carboxynorspermidine decarboxylase [Pelagerythrobacter marinus]WPZ08342.1 carboxynorspermidine decarboxylase [Pelagerythrobacter marinus]
METRAGDPGAFAHFDLDRVDSPAFVVDAAKLRANLQVLADIRDAAEIKVLAALKAFSMWSVAPIVGEYLDGVCTSGLWEARLAGEFYDGEIATYSAAYKPEELEEICRLSDHVIFNTPAQLERAALILDHARAGGQDFDVGLRINPQVPTGEVPRYDPSSPGSRLGFPIDQLTREIMERVDGIHFHNLCEQDFEPLERTWDKVFDAIEPWFGQLKWINMGGGHHITRADYQREELIEFLRDAREDTGAEIYLEPGEAVALDAGILVGTILDSHWNGMELATLDVSATCHMPDVIEAPYRPAMLGEGAAGAGEPVRLGGPSCLAGDVIGDYRLPVPCEPGRRIAFLDQAHYSMVKTNTFNGVQLPSIWLWDSETDALEQVRSFGYEDFRDRLS